MKKLLLFSLLIATVVCLASEKAYKAMFQKDTNILVTCDAAAWDKFSKDNKLEELFSSFKDQNSENSEVSASLQKKIEEKLKDNKVQKAFVTAAISTTDILSAADKKSAAKGLFFLIEMESPLSIDLVMDIATEAGKKDEVSCTRADLGDFEAVNVKVKEDEFVIVLVDAGKTVVAGKLEELRAYLERYKSGSVLDVPSKLADLAAATGSGSSLVISFAMPDGMDKYLSNEADKVRESNMMNATFMDTGSKMQGLNIALNPNGNSLDVKLCFLMNTPEDAIQVKAFIFEGMLKPMLGMMMNNQGQPYAFVQKLQFGCENRCATATTSISLDEITSFVRTMSMMRP